MLQTPEITRHRLVKIRLYDKAGPAELNCTALSYRRQLDQSQLQITSSLKVKFV